MIILELVINMDETRLCTLEQVPQFLSGSGAAESSAAGNDMRRYTAEDVRLLVEVDKAHEDICGPAIAHLLRRAWRDYGDARYERLATLSVSHLYNPHRSAGYQQRRIRFTETRAVKDTIGLRKVPAPDGRAGFVRIATVHQGGPGRHQGRLSHHLCRGGQSVAGSGLCAG